MKPLEELNFSDDFMFWKVMAKPELCRQVLEIILNRKIRDVHFSTNTQHVIENAYQGHGIRLDVFAADEHNTHYNIEMQMNKKYNLRKRSRYYRGQVDLDLLQKGIDYDELPETIIIFICLFDEFGRGRSIYTFKEICEEDMTIALEDETRIIFLNSLGDTSNAPPELKAFLTYLNDPVTAKTTTVSLISSLQNEVDDVKKRSGVKEEYMKFQLLLKEQHKEGYKEGHIAGLAEGIETGRTQGITEGQQLLCRQMLANGMSIEDISKYTGLDFEEIRSLTLQET